MIVLTPRVSVRPFVPSFSGRGDEPRVAAAVSKLEHSPDKQHAFGRISWQFPGVGAKSLFVSVLVPWLAVVSGMATDPHRMPLEVFGLQLSKLPQLFRCRHVVACRGYAP